ncbi:MAG: hypothetical protein KA716_11785 [Gloeotrichia echinulata DEX184]|nr:hypothetical protein [Gloeotrichia echinulata DEX184]
MANPSVFFPLVRNPGIDARIALDWIKDGDHPHLRQVGLPEFAPEEKEEKSIWMIQQICKLAEIASLPVLICFDQLDSAGTDSDSGDSPAETIAKCIDKIYFQCNNVILICCVISDTWREIENMGSGIPRRVGERQVTAKPPTAEQMIELVKLRLDWFYSQNNLNAKDYPDLYPFEKGKIGNIASQSASSASLMKWCAEEFEKALPISGNRGQVDPPVNQEEKKKKEFVDKYNDLLNEIDILINDDDKLAAIITCGMKMIPDGGTENVVVTKVETISHASHDLQLIVSGYDSLHQRNVKIGIRVSETTNGKTFNAVMSRLLNYKKYGITRGCLIRSTSVPKTWKTGFQLKDELEKQKGGEVVVLKKQEIRPLAAIEKIYEQAENYGFSKQEVTKFVKELRLAADNTLICEILSAPA